ncbi:MAG: hypothetical protein LBR79_07475 [Oscillospiraceae bacterium]|nr:hypothetical protein [Oscillospiraceae bacterium]
MIISPPPTLDGGKRRSFNYFGTWPEILMQNHFLSDVFFNSLRSVRLQTGLMKRHGGNTRVG